MRQSRHRQTGGPGAVGAPAFLQGQPRCQTKGQRRGKLGAEGVGHHFALPEQVVRFQAAAIEQRIHGCGEPGEGLPVAGRAESFRHVGHRRPVLAAQRSEHVESGGDLAGDDFGSPDSRPPGADRSHRPLDPQSGQHHPAVATAGITGQEGCPGCRRGQFRRSRDRAVRQRIQPLPNGRRHPGGERPTRRRPEKRAGQPRVAGADGRTDSGRQITRGGQGDGRAFVQGPDGRPLPALELGQQRLPQQWMPPEPTFLVVDRTQQHVASGEMTEQCAAAGAPQDRVTQLTRGFGKNRRTRDEDQLVLVEFVPHLVAQIAQDRTGPPDAGLHRVGHPAVEQDPGDQGNSHRPTLCHGQDGVHAVGLSAAAGQQQGGLLPVEIQIHRTDVAHPGRAGSQPGHRHRHCRPGYEHDLTPRRHGSGHERQQAGGVGPGDRMDAIEDQHERNRRFGQLPAQGRQHHTTEAFACGGNRLQWNRRRLYSRDRCGEPATQDQRVVVFVVDVDPDERSWVGIGPLTQQGGLAVPGRRTNADHRLVGDAQPAEQPATGHRSGALVRTPPTRIPGGTQGTRHRWRRGRERGSRVDGLRHAGSLKR